jgi:hypothetical protein
MISHKHKCIFVHIPKAAGTSIENMFLKDLGLDINNRHSLILGKSNNKNIGTPRVSHLLAKEYVEHSFISQELFDSYFKFSFTRNPYDRIYSSYKYWKFCDYMSFDTFVLKKLPEIINDLNYSYFFRTQYDYLYDRNKLLVDFVGKFENLKTDIQIVLENLSLKHLRLEHLNKSSNGGLTLYYKFRLAGRVIKDYKYINKLSFNNKNNRLSKEAKTLIVNHYKKDFIFFDYDIDN